MDEGMKEILACLQRIEKMLRHPGEKRFDENGDPVFVPDYGTLDDLGRTSRNDSDRNDVFGHPRSGH